jgi:SAM-dependent methyltransferase
MRAVDRYTGKAICYAQCRWDYAKEATDAISNECGLSESSTVADIGSGTGMLTRHFARRVGTIFAVEPNPDMRAVADDAFKGYRSYRSVVGVSDKTTLPDKSIDLIVVGRALHWFPADSTRAEFRRILKPEGWFAVFTVPCTDQSLLDSLKTVRAEQNGWDTAAALERTLPPPGFYFGHQNFRKLIFPGIVRETWETFLRRISSMSPAPGPDHPLRRKFEEILYEVFKRHATDGILTVTNATEVVFGRIL